VQRGTGRNGVDHRRHAGRDEPRAGQRGGREPDACFEAVITVLADLDDRLLRVGDIAQWRSVDGSVGRGTVEDRREFRPVDERNSRRLRYRIGDQRLLRLRRAGNRCQHDAGGCCFRNPREVGGQAARWREGPRPTEGWRAKPASGEQGVVVVVRRIDQYVGGRVFSPQQRRPRDRNEVRLPLEDDQFGRHLRYMDGRCASRQGRLRVGAGAAIEQIHDAFFREILREVFQPERRGRHNDPRPVERGCRHPAVQNMQVPAAITPDPGDQCLGVDDTFEARVGNLLDARHTIDRHQNCRRIADDNLGWRVVDLYRFWPDRLRSGKLPASRSRDMVAIAVGNCACNCCR
jgi:hypothetical protein